MDTPAFRWLQVCSNRIMGGAQMAQPNDYQVGGTHYKGTSQSGQQHWDMAWDFRLDFFQYQITRYLFRWRRKAGLEDLRKAKHFIEKYIEVAEAEAKRDVFAAQCENKVAEATAMAPGGLAGTGPIDRYHGVAEHGYYDVKRR